MSAPSSTAQSAPARDDVQRLLEAERDKIYPREVHGLFALFRTLFGLILLGVYYGIPWLSWNHQQLILFDLPQRKFHIFGLVFWPQDLIYLTFLLIIAGLGLFLFTAVAGRLWCGYTCPQTVWTEVFLWLERKIEGGRQQQIKLDNSSWTVRKLRLKVSKHTLWLLFAVLTGFTFVGYFTPIRELAVKLVSLNLGPWEAFWIVFFSLLTYANAGWLREQICKYACPYARFQSAMFDKDTLIVSYDGQRGEPRGSRRRGVDHRGSGLGDCIDCTLCVQVCPTGIDIRKGLQYECIGCSACIDVCDGVMAKMDYPRGLIRYTTEHALQGRKTWILRPRVVIYGMLLVLLVSGLGYALSQRIPLELDVIRDRNRLYRERSDGRIENVYMLKVMNKDVRPHHYTVRVEGIPDLRLETDLDRIEVASGRLFEVPARVHADEDSLVARSTKVFFTLAAADDEKLILIEEARFLGPG